jgi:glutaredoxin
MEDAINPIAVEESAPRATIYSKDHCASCVRVKLLLDRIGASYELIDLTGDIEGMLRVARLTGRTTLPQVFIGDELIGGFEDVSLALQNPRIREVLGAN